MREYIHWKKSGFICKLITPYRCNWNMIYNRLAFISPKIHHKFYWYGVTLQWPYQGKCNFQLGLSFQVIFDTIRIRLTHSPILIFPDPNEPFVHFTGTTKHSQSGVLKQERVKNINDKDVKSFLSITCVKGTFVGCWKTWATLRKEA